MLGGSGRMRRCQQGVVLGVVRLAGLQACAIRLHLSGGAAGLWQGSVSDKEQAATQ